MIGASLSLTIHRQVRGVLTMTEQTQNQPPSAVEPGPSLADRVDALEHALASLAAPQLSQSEHDGHFLLSRWFAGLKQRFLAASAKAQEPASK